ncbi:MAG TPA: zf-HC2 domain-containing protein [Pyrinomonadaceae bacterium]|jgi:anti-sigma factor RsiW
MRQTPRHIPFARLADLAEGRLSPEEAAEGRAHLAGCTACSAQAAQVGHLAALMRADTSEDAPAELVASAVRMFRARRAARAEEPGLLRRLVAALTFDSSSLRPAFGVRSGQAAPARQMLFSAGDLDVDLRLAAGGDGWTVSGQVLGPCENGEVELVSGGETAARAALNELCEFTLPAVAGGDYTLRLRLGGTEVEIPELGLKA